MEFIILKLRVIIIRFMILIIMVFVSNYFDASLAYFEKIDEDLTGLLELVF